MPKPKSKPNKATSGSNLTKALKLANSQMAVAFRHIKPSWKHYLDYVESAAKEGDKEMQKVIQAYYSLTRREQAVIMPEQLCELAGVKPDVLFGAVCQQLWSASKMECNIITAVHMPKVVEKTMKRAATNAGTKEREMVHKHSGFLPTPKPNPSAPPIFINAAPTNGHGLPGGAPVVTVLPSMEDEMLNMEQATATVPLLPSPKQEVVDVDSTRIRERAEES